MTRYSDNMPYEKRRFWYFTTHGIGPGTIPEGVYLLEVKEGCNKKGTRGDFICLDSVLSTNELRTYDLKEEVPPEEGRMTNAEMFETVFGLCATELWSMPERDFLIWLSSDAKESEGIDK